MIKTERINNKLLLEGIKNIKTNLDVLVVEINPKHKFIELTQLINNFFSTYPYGEVILFSNIRHLRSVGQFEYDQEFEILEKIGKSYLKRGKKVNTIRIGSILEDEKNYLNTLIKDIHLKKKIFYTETEQFRYFISLHDVIRAVEKIIKSSVKGEIFNITLSKVREKELVARLLEHYDFNMEPLENFKDKFSEKILELESNKLINFKPEKTISDYIKTTINKKFIYTKKSKKSSKFKLKLKLPTLINDSKINHLIGFIKTVITAIIFAGFLSILDFGLDNYYLYNSLKNSDWDNALIYSNKLRELPLPTKIGNNYQKTYNAIYYALNALEITKKDIINEGEINPGSVASVMGISTKALDYAESINPTYFLTPLEKDLFNSKIGTIKGLQEKTKYLELLNLYPDTKKEQTALVLIQNSNELRPSGGFIGSYAIVKTANLKVTDYKFDDIYNVDGTLETKHKEVLIEMPSEYINFIKTNYLFSRDANLVLEADKRNEILLSYFEKALEINIDYIVYVNLNSLKGLLSITGPVKMATYNEEVTAENFDTLAQTYSEKNYYEGSTQKKNFLTLLGGLVMQKLFEDQKISLDLLINILDQFESKDIVLYSKNHDYQKVIQSLELDGNVINREKFKDYLYIIETNLGENKVNKKTEKKVELKINYDQRRGVKTNDLFVTLSNFSSNYNWPYGDYQGYLQVGIPETHFVTQAKIKQIDTSNEIDISRNLIIKKINNINMVYIPFSVRPLEEIFITLSYETKDPIFLDTSYKLKVQKQPGTNPYELKVSLNVPDQRYLEKDFIVNKDLNVNLD